MVANIDQLLVVVSAGKPKPDLLLVDKLLLYAAHLGVERALVINKVDTDRGFVRQLEEEYAGAGIEILPVSAQTGQGLEALGARLRGKTTCFAGQSAVGKSSLLNALSPQMGLETGGLSKKTDRGRHTTRHSELYYL